MLYEAKVTIAVTGTAIPLSSVRAGATWVQVQSLSTNNAAGQNLGGADVTGPGGGGSKPGAIMAPGGTMFLPQTESPTPYDLQTIFVNGTVGDVFSVLYFRR